MTTDTATDHAEELLLEWGAVYRDRDARILLGLLAGMPKARIHRLMGIARNTVEAVLEEYTDRSTGTPVIDTAAVLRARARVTSGMTAPEFDFSLSNHHVGDKRAVAAMADEAFRMANEGHPPVQPDDGPEVAQAHRDRGDALWTETWPQVEAMIARARQMTFTNWSTEAQARGRKLDYAREQS
ncbi:hypothetical protein [Saccharothrix xinjiangensis]|uniref:Uncharacterized protein n=1 Tax=Saccharothrix xinjiangensis TaxID=204798 RepID=A0ABV9XTU1_9PSEU